MTRNITTVGPDSLDQVDVYFDGQPTLLALTAAERRELAAKLLDDDAEETEGPDLLVEATVTIFAREGEAWLQIAGNLFGPFDNENEAVNAIPEALHTLD